MDQTGSSAHSDDLATEVGRLVTERGWTVAVAESLTGGLLVQALARVDGSSEWLAGGVVAYSRDVKHRLLAVSSEKVVSAAAAAEMATGVRTLLRAGAAVAVTGVAGPDPQDGEPPGTVWLGVDLGDGPTSTPLRTGGTPAEICGDAVAASLRLLLDALRDARPVTP
jgi:PncC family amidohydrolase